MTASLNVAPDRLEEALRMCVDHVHRSRAEPGCAAHAVSQDVEDPNHVFFVERWTDRAALEAHFLVPDGVAFSRALGAMTTSHTDIAIYDVTDPA